MAVPAHDERDFAFAQQFGLPIRRVVAAPGTEADDADGATPTSRTPPASAWSTAARSTACRPTRAARRSSRSWPSSRRGRAQGHLPPARLADQPPALLGHADPDHLLRPTGSCPVPDEDLPVLLPETSTTRAAATTRSTTTRRSCDTTCPSCGGPARRETDTMDTFIDSSWYWFRYLSPGQGGRPGRPRAGRSTGRPVDQYTGGAEHAVMHLLYSRFWTKAMRDIGLVEQDEPFKRLFNQGQILGADGERMSKSRGNVQDPDELVAALRRRHGPAVPDVHGPVGPGRAVEPDRDRRRPSLPEPRLDAGARPARSRARRSRRGQAAGRRDEADAPSGASAPPPIGRCAT